ncbi:MAG: major facilitator family protein MmrA [Pseudomonadota bacterium]
MSTPAKREARVVFAVAAVQFVNVLDFVMVTPLGPFFGPGLGIPADHLGYVSASYTAAASVAGLGGALVLDRFDRRRALAVCMAGLSLATALGGAATGHGSLLAARVLAGLFGGPATSLAYAIVADAVPGERRGRALGVVMSAFSVASVVGIPAGLYAAELGGWRAPFLALGALGLCVTAAVVLLLPPLRAHLEGGPLPPSLAGVAGLVRKPVARWSWTLTATVMLAGFSVIPNLPAYLVGNLGVPQADVKLFYAAGGVASFLVLRLGGRWVDRAGSLRVMAVAAPVLVAVLVPFVVWPVRAVPPAAFFVAFLFALGLRNVAHGTVTSRVAEPSERAGFQSIQSAVQHAASAGGALLSASLLATDAEGHLLGMARVGAFSAVLTLLLPLLVARVQRGLPAAH